MALDSLFQADVPLSNYSLRYILCCILQCQRLQLCVRTDQKLPQWTTRQSKLFLSNFFSFYFSHLIVNLNAALIL